LFIVEQLDLVVEQQTPLLTAKGLSSVDKVKLVARAVRQNRGIEFLSIYKFALDSKNSTVYVLAINEEDANLMAGNSFEVAGETMPFYRVLNINLRPQQEDVYQIVNVDRIFGLLPCLV